MKARAGPTRPRPDDSKAGFIAVYASERIQAYADTMQPMPDPLPGYVRCTTPRTAPRGAEITAEARETDTRVNDERASGHALGRPDRKRLRRKRRPTMKAATQAGDLTARGFSPAAVHTRRPTAPPGAPTGSVVWSACSVRGRLRFEDAPDGGRVGSDDLFGRHAYYVWDAQQVAGEGEAE